MSTRAMAGEIEKLTGTRPISCPWRAFWDPLVREVLHVANLAEKVGSAAIEPGSPAILFDALEVYHSARAAVRNHDDEQRRIREEQQRKQPKR